VWDVLHPGHLQEKAQQTNADLFTTSVNELAEQFLNHAEFIGLAPCVRKKI
jgi:hypothetical protein